MPSRNVKGKQRKLASASAVTTTTTAAAAVAATATATASGEALQLSKQDNKVAKNRPNKLLITAAQEVLCKDYAAKLKSSGFEWSDDVLAAIKARYESLGGKGGLEPLSQQNWRHSRMRSARNSLNIGIVRKKSNGGDKIASYHSLVAIKNYAAAIP